MGRQATHGIGGSSRWLAWALAACLLASLTALPAAASVAPPDDVSDPDAGPASWAPEPAGRLEVASSPGVRSLWTWMAGNRGYALSGTSGYTSLDAYDLDTYASVGSTPLDPPAYVSGNSASYGNGSPHTITVDEAGGRLFVAYAAPRDANNVGTHLSTTVAGQLACPVLPSSFLAEFNCVGGIHVLDAASLEPVRPPVPLRNIRPETDGFRPWIRAMAYAPPRTGAQENGKVLMVLEDRLAAGYTVQSGQPRLKGVNPVYAVQLDPMTGVQDWAVRIDACRGARESEGAQLTQNGDFGHPSAIFRSASLTDPAVFVACHNGTAQTAVVVKLPLDAAGNASFLPARTGADPTTVAPETLEGGQTPPQAPQPQTYAPQSTSPRTAVGPTTVFRQIADPVRERILMQSTFGEAEVWWVFDTAKFAFIGTIGIGPIGVDSGTGGRPTFDPVSGRLYVQGAAREGTPAGTAEGLFITDTAADPLPQALVFTGDWPLGSFLSVIPPTEGRPPRLLAFAEGAWLVFEDRVPLGATSGTGVPADGSDDVAGGAALTLDLDEVEGVTQASFDGTARGYGARAVLVGGLEAAGRVDRFDPGWWYQLWMDGLYGQIYSPPLTIGRGVLENELGMGSKHPCSQSNRELVLAFVGPEGDAVVDGSGSRGSAQPVRYDSGTQADTELPVSRCGFMEWAQYWNVGLFGRPPVEEPSLPTQGLKSDTAQCISSDADPSSSVGDAVGDGRAAKAECAQEEASGFGYVRGVTVTDNAVGEALSSFRVYRDPGRGIVSRVESVARGIGVGGLIHIDTVRGSAESWANGRRQPVDKEQRDPGYLPNCDVERSAGTCFKRQLFGVRTPAYSCGPCGNENQAVDAMSRALGSNGRVQLREPDPALSAGTEDGYQAAILKPASERFTDAAIHNDFLTTIVPTLEIVRYAPPSPPGSSQEASIKPLAGPRGLQVYQFAGVAVSSTYSIQCLLIYDAATNTCAGEQQAPGAIQISLSDSDGKPLAGGAFEIRQDIDADGVLGLKDTLLPNGACVTADDGVGTCKLDNLQPGSYLVAQVAAPPGFAKSAEPFVVELASGEQRTVAFTNVSNVSTIELKATDENGAPLSGAVFAAYPDPDSDGKVAPDATPAAECTTDGQGACQMKVPAGSYVLVQTSAPGGLEGIEPVAFTFASGGQVASVSVVNYPPGAPQAPEGAAAPISYTPPVDYAPPTEIINDSYVAPTQIAEPDVAPAPSFPDLVGGTVTQVIRAPGDALRLLARDPKQAVAWTAALALFCLAVMAVRRRQHALALIDG